MQRVAELVERRGHLVPGQQRGLAGRRLGHVEVVGHYRLVAGQARLRHVGIHPRAAALGVARIRVEDEDCQLRTVGVEHVVGPGVGVVLGQVGAFLEAQPVQLVGGVEHAVLQHVLHLEVRLELRFVEVVLGRAHLLGVEGPVPWLQLEARLALGLLLPVDHRLQVGGLALGVRHRGRRQFAEHRIDGFRRARGLVFQAVGGVVGIAQQLRAVGAQLHDARDQRGGVELAAAAAARDRGFVQAPAQRAVGQLRFRRLAGGVEQGQHVLAVQAAVLRRFGGGGDLRLGQAVELLHVVHDHGRSVHFLPHVVAEPGAQRGQFGVHRLQRGLVGVVQVGAGADEAGVVALDQSHALRVQAQGVALFVQRLDAGEELGIEVDGVAVRGELRRVVGAQLVARVVGVGADQVEEHGGGAVQHLAGLLQRDDGVVEGGRGRVAGDGVDLLQLLGHAGVEGGGEIAVLDPVELRVMQRQRALREEGIGGLDGGGGRCGGLAVGGHGESQGRGEREGEAGGHRSAAS